MRKIFIIGSGAREHAFCLKALKSSQVFCAPGNPGIAEIVQCIPIPVDKPKELLRFAQDNKVDLTIVGPELALASGIVDLFLKNGLLIFGPTKQAAQLETSKIFAKKLMQKYKIPTAQAKSFNPKDITKVKTYLKLQKFPVVIKDEGLAAGKGVLIIDNFDKALKISITLLKEGKAIIIEEFLEGDEVSVTAICKGTDFLPMLVTQDHKQLFKGGPNTGGMGVYTPVSFVSKKLETSLYQDITQKTLDSLAKMKIHFTGFLYSNLILTKDGPKVLEHNTRMGDPETQAMLPLLENDLVDVLLSVLAGDIKNLKLNWLNKFGVSLTLASHGYPGNYGTGKIIEGINEAEKIPDVKIHHAGTKILDGNLVTAGGRVLSVVALGNTLEEAVNKVYQAANKIHFDGVYYRKDIAQRSLKSFPI